ELAERARDQACKFGADILVGREGIKGEFLPGKTVGHLADGTKIISKTAICATGVDYRRLVDRIYSTANIEVLNNTIVTAVYGDRVLDAITIRDVAAEEEEIRKTRWLFVCIGGVPRTDWAEEVGIIRDRAGYIVTGPDLLQDGQRPDGWPLDRDP